MKKIGLVLVITFVSIFGFSQKQIKTIYSEVESFNKWSNQKSNVYTTYNKSGSEIESGSWEYISDLKKYKKTKIKPIKKIELYNANKKLLSSTTLIEKGSYKGLDETKTIFYYKNNGDLNKKVHYYASIDTMDLGYEEYNKTRKVSSEYIDYNFDKESVELYENGKLKKRINYLWGQSGELFTYDKNDDLIKTEMHDFNNDDFVKFTDKNIKSTLTYSYNYDEKGNWIEMKAYNSNKKLIKKNTRVIEYF